MVNMDVAAAQNAVKVASQYPNQIHAAAAAAAGVPLGPWHLSVSCKYGQSDKYTASYNEMVDFKRQRTQLQTLLANAEKQAAQFVTKFNFVKVWMGQSLPETCAAFDKAFNAEEAAMSAQKKQGKIPPEARAALIASLDGLMATLQASSEALSAGSQGLAAFSLNQEKYGAQINGVIASMSATGQNALASMRANIAHQPCGSADGMRQMQNFVTQFDAATKRFRTIFETLTGNTKAANDAVSLLMGTVLNFQNGYRPVITKVKQAEDAKLATVMQNFHLSVARGQWQQLEEFARSQLQSERQALAQSLNQRTARAAVASAHVAAVENAVARVYGVA